MAEPTREGTSVRIPDGYLTREDVETLRDVGEGSSVDDGYMNPEEYPIPQLRSLADRIEALLPPEAFPERSSVPQNEPPEVR